ncbi:MAG: TonB-dependent receptor [Candidatus Eisenbacteria bacterium]|jgi:outer membrane receptor for ferrienterochelin and colicin|nr:TonB-dependent receptor [Candidatus Eisenbacteria bacterium]
MNLRRVFCVVLAIACLSGTAMAGTTGKLAGRITDNANSQPLVGAYVIVEELMAGAIADEKGEYVILNLPPGIYTLRSEMIGYSTVKMTRVPISADLTTTIDLSLDASVLELGQTVDVVAVRSPVQMDLTSASSVVGSSEIDNLPVEQVQDVLTLQAGVIAGAFGGIHIRGGRTDEVAYWVDGVATTDVYEGGQGVQVQNSSVEELQVISGTFNAEYGQAMSGVVNIVTNSGGSEYEGALTAYVDDAVSNDDEIFYNIDDIGLGTFNGELTLSGPLTAAENRLTFFALGRYYDTDGHLYGMRIFNPDGTAGDSAAVAMAWSKNLYLQGKLAYQATNTLKFTYGLFFEDSEYKEYDHYFKYNPEGVAPHYNDSQTHILTVTHSLSPTTFYEFRGTRLSRTYQRHLYDDPYDDRYVHPDSLVAPADYSFGVGGTQMNQFERSTEYWIGKLDLLSQVTKRHQLKGGVEMRLHQMTLDDAEVRPRTSGAYDSEGVWDPLGGSEIVPFEPTIHPLSSPYHDAYDKKPMELSAFVQDKIEFREVILNLGLRFDYFEPDGQTLTDPKDPDVNNPMLPEHIYRNYSPDLPDSDLVEYTLAERQAFWYKAASTKTQVSPRLGVAYPISDRGAIHFSYGHFFQIPQFRFLYENPEFEVARGEGLGTIMGNADLEPQRTVMYEVGLQQALSDADAFDVTMFYRDIRDWVGTSEAIDTYVAGTAYSKYVNRDYANARGVTLTYDRRFSGGLSAGVDYSFMVVEGTASDPADAYNASRDNQTPRISLIPLGWDRTHTLNANVAVGSETWRASLLGRFSSGEPYTPTFARGEVSGAGQYVGLRDNSARKPNAYTVDLKLYKKLSYTGLDYSLFLNVFNLFDRRNEVNVYSTTGRATYDLDAQQASDNPSRPNTVEEYVARPEYYSEPRKIQAGLTVSF